MNRMQTILDLLPESGCTLTSELTERSRLDRRAVADTCCKLKARGLIERVRTGCFRLTELGRIARDSGKPITSGPAGPHTGRRRHKPKTLVARVWKAFRTLKKATLGEMLELAQRTEKDAETPARRYLNRLVEAGYAARLPRRRKLATDPPTSNGEWVYVLLRDTGPEAPHYSPVRGDLFDPNTNETIPLGDSL